MRLETERLFIEPFTLNDIHKVAELANNQEIASILGLPHPYESRIAQEWIQGHQQRIEGGTEFPLRIVLKESNEIIGTITLRVDKANNRGELGYWMGRDFWGRGYASDAALRLVDFGFRELGLNRIWATAITRNKSSIRVLEKAGLRHEGILIQNRLLADTYEDVAVFGLVKSDYLDGPERYDLSVLYNTRES
jgi:hypothetical protein